jgi:nucleotide-binding universal stress UspA family protein
VVEPVEINMPGVPSPEDIVPQLKVAAGERLAALLAAEIPTDIRAHQVVGAGNVHREILRVAGEIRADLIVMASHRPALKDYLLGAHAARVVRHAKCSVHVVRPR